MSLIQIAAEEFSKENSIKNKDVQTCAKKKQCLKSFIASTKRKQKDGKRKEKRERSREI